MTKFKAERSNALAISSKTAIRQDGMKSQLEWIKRQLEYADFSEKYQLRYDLKRGEIYEFDWGINVNAEFSNRHYGVVMVDSDIFNPLVTVCPLKSNHLGINPKSDVDLGFVPELGTRNSTIAVINQVRTMDKLRIYTRRAIGVKSSDGLAEINEMENRIIIRLKDDKLNMLLEAYKKYIMNEFGSRPVKVD